ncbi:isocitrate/isopropylmalate dehydrogenase family protein [Muricoccus radiodurans]|uniref:isocitrate/isopropylmalate dehydrogenase family protein n=1 Tax=Muricoccus radiodurans TaxID=2231721 RepID=UPI003CF5ECE5
MDIVVLPGDGIGPEITEATLEVLRAADARHGLGLTFETHDIGFKSLETHGTTLRPEVFERACRADGTILGPVSHLDYPSRDKGGINQSAEFRVKADLYANIRPARSREGLPHYGRTPMDLVIVRECTEGFYADRNMHVGIGEFMPTEDIALAVRKITRKASDRIARTAFDLARGRRKKVTAVHKANVMKVSDSFFLSCVRAVAKEYPDVAYDELIIDATAALLVRDAARFDVIVTTNMFGDILSDEASELSGSLGLAGSVNAGDTACVAQAQHGSAPDIQGQDRANPTSLILSAAMMLDWIGTKRGNAAASAAAKSIEAAVDKVLNEPSQRTRDLPGGTLGTAAFGRAVAAAVGSA